MKSYAGFVIESDVAFLTETATMLQHSTNNAITTGVYTGSELAWLVCNRRTGEGKLQLIVVSITWHSKDDVEISMAMRHGKYWAQEEVCTIIDKEDLTPQYLVDLITERFS